MYGLDSLHQKPLSPDATIDCPVDFYQYLQENEHKAVEKSIEPSSIYRPMVESAPLKTIEQRGNKIEFDCDGFVTAISWKQREKQEGSKRKQTSNKSRMSNKDTSDGQFTLTDFAEIKQAFPDLDIGI